MRQSIISRQKVALKLYFLVSAAKYGQDKIVRQILKCQRKRSRREPTADLLEVLNDLGETAADVALRSGNFFVSHSLEAEKQQRADSPGHRYLHTSLDAITSARSDEEGLVEPIRRLKFTSSPNLAGVNQRYSPADHSNGFDLLADISVTVDLRAEPSRVSRTKSVGPTTAAPPLAKPNLADRIRKFIRRKSHGELHKPESNSELSGSAHKYRSDDQPTNSSPEVPSSTRVSRQSPPAATSVDNLAKFRLLLRRQHDLEPTALKRSETSVWPPTLQPAAPDDRQTPPPITLRRNQTGKRGKNNQQPLRALPPLRGFQPIQK